MDYLGKEYIGDSNFGFISPVVAYLKLINTPTMFDVGCVESDPCSDFLTLNMIDEKTYFIEK